MTDSTINWSEEDSAIYQQLARIAVPDREEQVATITALLPFDRNAAFKLIELGSGEGFLSEVILECFPNARVLALDGSDEMRATASRRLERFGERFRVEPFDIEDLQWVERARGADAVVSSLCVHHLDGAGKQEMFRRLARALNPGGALIVADLVSAKHPVAHHYLGETWDHEARARAQAVPGTDGAWELFQQEKWNLYWWPDEMDRPSPLSDQLVWLASAGFDPVDCFWLKGAHAIYGGYLPGRADHKDFVGFASALAVSRNVFGVETS